MTAEHPLVHRAAQLADEVLWPAAGRVDAGLQPPQLDRLAADGWYGLFAPAALGGLAADALTAARVVEAFAGGCLTTTFVWLQHQGVVKRVAASPVAGVWLADLAAGRRRAGVGIGGIRPGRAPLRARTDGDGWRLHGMIPWVTGWGMVDLLLLAAIDDHEQVVWLLVDAPPLADGEELRTTVPTVRLRRVGLVAADGANSAVVALDGHPVAGDRLVARQTYRQWQRADATGLRLNGSLPLGLAGRCATLLDDGSLARAVGRVRAQLDEAAAAPDPAVDLPEARAAAAGLAWDAVARLVVSLGGRAVLRGGVPDRLTREAMLLQVFGTRPPISEARLAGLRRRQP